MTLPESPVSNPLDPSQFEQPDIWTQVATEYTALLLPVFEQYALHALKLCPISASWRVLDLACGPGTLSLPAARRCSRVDAVDFSEQMLRELAGRLDTDTRERVHPLMADGHALPFDSKSFDAAFSMFGLVFFSRPREALRGLRRVLCGQAPMVLSLWATPAECTVNAVGVRALRAAFQDLPSDAEIFHGTRSPEQWAALVESEGFLDVRVESLSLGFEIPSAEQFWNSQVRASVPALLLRNACSESEWQRANDAALAVLRGLTPWPHPVEAKGYFIVARTP